MSKYTCSASLVLGLCTALAAGAENLVANGDLEIGDVGATPANWTLPHPDPQLTAVIVEDDGNRCVKMTMAVPRKNPGAMIAQIQTFGITKGQWYCTSFRARCEGLESIGNDVGVYVTNMADWKRTWGAQVEFDDRWRQHEFVWQARRDIPQVHMRFQFGFRDCAGSIWLDDVRVEQTSMPKSQDAVKPTYTVPKNTNLLTNAGLEYGTHGWVIMADRSVDEEWWQDREGAAQGQYCLRSRAVGEWGHGRTLCSAVVRVEKGHTYTFSVALRSNVDPMPVLLEVGPGLRPPHGTLPPLGPTSRFLTVGTSWQRYAITFDVPADYPSSQFFVSIGKGVQQGKPAIIAPGTLWADAVCLTKGTSTDYIPTADETLGLEVDTDRLGGLYVVGSGRSVRMIVRNAQKTPRRATVDWTLTDVWQRKTAEGTEPFHVGGQASTVHDVDVLPDLTGSFTLATTLRDEQGEVLSTDEFELSRVPLARPVKRNAGFTGFNIHAGRFRQSPGQNTTNSMSVMGQCGTQWVRLWWHWNMVQPSQDKWTFEDFDRQLEAAESAGLNVIACLNTIYDPDSWRYNAWESMARAANKYENDQQRLEAKKLVEAFVQKLVTRYKGRITYWQIDNEPYGGTALPKPGSTVGGAENHLVNLETAYHAARTIDPDCKILGFPSVNMYAYALLDWLLANGMAEHTDVLCFHPYDMVGSPEARYEQWWRNVRPILGKHDYQGEVWFTEGGIETERSGYLGGTGALSTAAMLIRNFVVSSANGVKVFTWFSGDCSPSYSYALLLGSTPKPALVATAIFVDQVGQTNTPRKIMMDRVGPGLRAYLYTRDNGPVVMAWSIGAARTRSIQLPCTPDTVTVADMMGNQVDPDRPDTTIVLSQAPVYVAAPTLDAAGLEKLFAGATYLRDRTQALPTGRVVEAIRRELVQAKEVIESPGPYRADEGGFIRDWLILGPFANPGKRGANAGRPVDFLESLGGEAKARLNQMDGLQYAFPDDQSAWPGLPDQPMNLYPIALHGKKVPVDLSSAIAALEVVSYVYCEVDCPDDRDAVLAIGSDDGEQTWLNGVKVLDVDKGRAATIDEDAANVKLDKGRNMLLVKVDQDIGGFSLALRFKTPDGKPMTDLTVWLPQDKAK